MVDLVDFSKHHPLQSTDIEDIVEWIRAKEKDGKVHKLSVIMESKDGKVYSNSINLLNKDYAYFLLSELIPMFVKGDDQDG